MTPEGYLMHQQQLRPISQRLFHFHFSFDTTTLNDTYRVVFFTYERCGRGSPGHVIGSHDNMNWIRSSAGACSGARFLGHVLALPFGGRTKGLPFRGGAFFPALFPSLGTAEQPRIIAFQGIRTSLEFHKTTTILLIVSPRPDRKLRGNPMVFRPVNMRRQRRVISG